MSRRRRKLLVAELIGALTNLRHTAPQLLRAQPGSLESNLAGKDDQVRLANR